VSLEHGLERRMDDGSTGGQLELEEVSLWPGLEGGMDSTGGQLELEEVSLWPGLEGGVDESSTGGLAESLWPGVSALGRVKSWLGGGSS
jgi:hypothetical protein